MMWTSSRDELVANASPWEAKLRVHSTETRASLSRISVDLAARTVGKPQASAARRTQLGKSDPASGEAGPTVQLFNSLLDHLNF